MDEVRAPIVDAAAVTTIAALVTALCQVVKRSVPGNLDLYGPLIAAILAAFGVALWVISAPVFPPARTDWWAIGAGWVAVFTSAVGIYESVKMVTATPALRFRGRRVVAPEPPPATDPITTAAVTRVRPRPAPEDA